MEILAQTKDPICVQKHLGKTFEAINSLDFNENMEICGMMSNLGEKVAFKNKIDVNKSDLKGQVEIWIREVEFEMINTLKYIALNINSNKTSVLSKLKADFPNMTILADN